MFPTVGASLVSQSCLVSPRAGPQPFLASKPASFSSLALLGFSAPGVKSPVWVCASVTVSAGSRLGSGHIFFRRKRPVIWEGRVLGVDEPTLPALLGSRSVVGQAPQGQNSRRRSSSGRRPCQTFFHLPLLPSQVAGDSEL